MEVPQDLAGRLKLALKVINLSPGALGAAVGVDKSVVSRWLSGKVVPNGHNLARVGAEIARRRPGFSTLSFEAPDEVFLSVLGLEPGLRSEPELAAAISLPFGALEVARRETERRGVEYFGHYAMYYWSFTQPGRLVRMALMLRPAGGLIEARYGANGFEFAGWALLMLNRLYIQFSEKRYEAMTFLLTNAGQQPRTQQMTGLLLGPSDRKMEPTTSPVLILREAEITGRGSEDEAEFARRQSMDPFAEGDSAPEAVRRALNSQVRITSAAGGPPALLQSQDLVPGADW